ncbi:MAG: hypothetical protein ACOCTH_03215, partial [Halodesulfurarchaeum sp.]
MSRTGQLRVLLAGVDPDAASTAADALEAASGQLAVRSVAEQSSVLGAVKREELKCLVVVDAFLERAGPDFLEGVLAASPGLPIVAFGEDVAAIAAHERFAGMVTEYVSAGSDDGQYS